ncbi:MAG: hypothetical protein CBD47_06530 [Synechococcus sp. TMED187]|nr:hypothetical protein [Synechococcus sp. NAT40]OUW46493.1 MAG: hypothetical protein CBD47_06530 [Synechococcus sp. TMED187]
MCCTVVAARLLLTLVAHAAINSRHGGLLSLMAMAGCDSRIGCDCVVSSDVLFLDDRCEEVWMVSL